MSDPVRFVETQACIEVRVTAIEMIQCHPSLLESLLVSKLRSAGVPVRGILVFGGVEHGTLSWSDEANRRIYRWRGVISAASLS